MKIESDGSKQDRIEAARAAKLKFWELDALIHQMPKGHPLRGPMRHALSKLWMFTREAFDAECVAATDKWESHADD